MALIDLGLFFHNDSMEIYYPKYRDVKYNELQRYYASSPDATEKCFVSTRNQFAEAELVGKNIDPRSAFSAIVINCARNINLPLGSRLKIASLDLVYEVVVLERKFGLFNSQSVLVKSVEAI